MILRPLPTGDPKGERVGELEPAWTIVSRTQAVETEQYLLIGQPDHARLSGELSALFRSPLLPEINDQISKAIAAHDDGWTRFPFERELHGEPPRTNTGRPKHFMQIPVQESIAAWTGSIKSAGEISRLGEYMVSAHFSRIGRARLQAQVDTPEDTRRLQEFVRGEEQWQASHEAEIGLPKEALSEYVDLLQFCDLLSLYLCCGSIQPAEFPQSFRGEQIRVRYDDGVYYTTPSLFGDTPQRFYLPVRIYPSAAGEGHTRLGFHVK
jgi:Protein of unknown function (DUF3891)